MASKSSRLVHICHTCDNTLVSIISMESQNIFLFHIVTFSLMSFISLMAKPNLIFLNSTGNTELAVLENTDLMTILVFCSPQESCVLLFYTTLAWQVKPNASILVWFICHSFCWTILFWDTRTTVFLQTCVIVISPDLSTVTWLVVWWLLRQNNACWFIYFFSHIDFEWDHSG